MKLLTSLRSAGVDIRLSATGTLLIKGATDDMKEMIRDAKAGLVEALRLEESVDLGAFGSVPEDPYAPRMPMIIDHIYRGAKASKGGEHNSLAVELIEMCHEWDQCYGGPWLTAARKKRIKDICLTLNIFPYYEAGVLQGKALFDAAADILGGLVASTAAPIDTSAFASSAPVDVGAFA
jgi:hypothetical protein